MAGSFTEAYRLYELYDSGTGWYTGTYSPWIRPGVGFVKTVRTEQDALNYPDGPLLTATWELISDHVAN